MTEPATYWVFGYGSLIWNPGFRHRSTQHARLIGAHRQLCIYSHRHRGTVERPGLVFGLVPGGSCRGMAFEVDAADWAESSAYLREREADGGVYREAVRPVRLADGRRVSALTFLVDLRHAQYAGPLAPAAQFDLVRAAHGQSGPNADYVRNTARHLADLGMEDARLAPLLTLLSQPSESESLPA
jgi:cation transport protein ChaC